MLLPWYRLSLQQILGSECLTDVMVPRPYWSAKACGWLVWGPWIERCEVLSMRALVYSVVCRPCHCRSRRETPWSTCSHPVDGDRCAPLSFCAARVVSQHHAPNLRAHSFQNLRFRVLWEPYLKLVPVAPLMSLWSSWWCLWCLLLPVTL